jgi:hypothetical protein
MKKRTSKKVGFVVEETLEAVDQTLANLFEVKIPNAITAKRR